MLLVVELHAPLQQAQLLLVLVVRRLVLLLTEESTRFGFFEVDLHDVGINRCRHPLSHTAYLEWTRADSLAEQHLPEVLHRRLILAPDAKIEAVVLVWDDRLVTVELVHEEGDVVLRESL